MNIKGRLAELFAPDAVPLCDPDAPYDLLVEGFREAPHASRLSAEELAKRWVILRAGGDLWSGI